ncbi:hypothetical protein V5799_007122 [Amblyomma americanum]|uniref:Uncharacterized protein n=1 Tax=Amblyomma americanum TaxID=6943 RepID=A0AAQ4DUF6_AMBAM
MCPNIAQWYHVVCREFARDNTPGRKGRSSDRIPAAGGTVDEQVSWGSNLRSEKCRCCQCEVHSTSFDGDCYCVPNKTAFLGRTKQVLLVFKECVCHTVCKPRVLGTCGDFMQGTPPRLLATRGLPSFRLTAQAAVHVSVVSATWVQSLDLVHLA